MKHKKNTEDENNKVREELMDETKQQEECKQECKSEENIPGTDERDKEIDNLKKQSEDYFNRLARMQADFENYKKRVTKEREEMYYVALETVFTQILPVVDNMERALGAFKNEGMDSKYIDGVDMVYKQLYGVLEKNGLKEIEAEGKEFDPNIHHAVMQEDDPENENKVKEVFQKGYILGSKVIRPTLVKVAK